MGGPAEVATMEMATSTYKLIALDMDGTVLNEEGIISEENRAWMRKAEEAGVTVIFSTGRGMPSIRPYIEELGMNGPVVAVNGSEVWKSPKELLVRHTLEPEVVERLHKIAVETDTWFWAYDTNGVYNRENWIHGYTGRTWLKFGYFTDNEQKLARIRLELEEWGVFEITNSHPHNLELNPKGVSKAGGIADVCGLLGIGLHQVIAMGDSLNDIAAIRAAGLGIAMSNAQDEVKRAADDITDTNEHDGVAKAIRKHIFGGG